MRLGISGDLLTFLQSGSVFVVAELFELTPEGKAAQYYTSAESPITYGGHVYESIFFDRGDIEEASGLQVAKLDLEVRTLDTDLLDGQTWQEAAVNGYFDEAQIVVSLLFLSDWATPAGAVPIFYGNIADTEVLLGTIRFTGKSISEVFSKPFPGKVYQATCPNLLYDANCRVVAATFAVSGTAAAGSDEDTILDASLTQADDYFAIGYVEFTSGDLSGMRRTVESSESGRLDLVIPFPQSPEVGDTFKAYPGCDRTKATCEGKFSNTWFAGQPYIPKPETLY